MSESTLKVFAFVPAWGLPSSGPFALKLIAWLRLAGIEHQLIPENNTMKAPKGKNPWIELDGQLMGDTELIIQHLGERHGVSLDDGLTPQQQARGLVLRRTAEEHLHQLLEYELILLDEGYPTFKDLITGDMGQAMGTIVAAWLRSHFRKQLHARGLIRHAPDEITRMGCADLDALETLLGDRDWFVADRPTLTDCAIYGHVAILIASELPTPVATHARSCERLVRWVQRMTARIEAADPALAEGESPRRVAV